MDFRDLQQQFLDRVQSASGKPVLLQSDMKFAGHATIKIATKDQAAHLLLYKPEQESVLPYLIAYQCEFALRTIMAEPTAQFDLVSKDNMANGMIFGDVITSFLPHARSRSAARALREWLVVLFRILQKSNNNALDKWFAKQDPNSNKQVIDLLNLNGDIYLERMCRNDATCKVRLVEESFGQRMSDVEAV